MTPATVGNDRGNAFRLGFFNTLGRETPVLIPDPDNPGETIQEVIDGVPQFEGVFGNVLASSNPETGPGPNVIYGSIANPSAQPGLPGLIAEYDVNDFDSSTPPVADDNIRFRQADPSQPSGRFLTTTSGGSFFELDGRANADDGAENEVLGWAPNTAYSGFVQIERLSETEARVSTFIDLPGFPQPETAGDPVEASTPAVADPVAMDEVVVPDSFTFDMLAFHVGSNTFGSSSSPAPGSDINDNGLDFSSISVETTGDVELPTTELGDFNGDGVVDCADLDSFIGNVDADAIGSLAVLDLNGDTVVNDADVDLHIETLIVTPNGERGTFRGDFNCDGEVNVTADAFILVANLLTDVDSYSLGDANLDGTVNVTADAFALVANLGSSNSD